MDISKECHKEKLTISIEKANVIAMLMIIPIGILFALPYCLIWGSKPWFSLSGIASNPVMSALTVVLALIIGIIVHEGIHGITWAIFAKKGFRSISFGILWKMLTPYCHCDEPMQVRHYVLGAIMPALLLGIIPSIVAIAIGNAALLVFGMFFTLAAGGDFLIIYTIRKEKPDTLVEDHPSEAGCFVYRKIVNTVEQTQDEHENKVDY